MLKIWGRTNSVNVNAGSRYLGPALQLVSPAIKVQYLL